MRFLISDALSGACFAAAIVLAAGHTQKITTAPTSRIPALAQENVERSEAVVQSSAESASKPHEPERTITGTAESNRSSAVIETASITAGDKPQKSEATSFARLPSFPAIDASARKPSGGLGAAADGGIDAYVPPVVRQRPATPPLKASVEGKPKEKVKVKSAASGKAKTQGKQASRTVTPASVRR